MLSTLLLTCLFLHIFENASTQDDNTILKNIFTETGSSCNSIEGEITNSGGCYNCYICDDYSSKAQIGKNKKDYKIRLFDNTCKPTEFCCFSQKDSVVRFSPTKCGQSNPEGFPRSTRNSLRSVLPGEFPWRVWIFKKTDLKNPLCAGVYIDISTRAILTSAKCVDDYSEEDLRLGFSRHQGSLRISDLKVHEDYNAETRHNDIAILIIHEQEKLVQWAHISCLPTSPPLFATSCIAISKDDFYLNTIIPKQTHCFDEDKIKDPVLCAVAPKDDYVPEFGSGLICEKETSMNKISYVLFGIFLYQHENAVSVYTNITNYSRWIDNNVKS